jgi:DNA-binding MarR family transcriptional regulator
VTDLIQAELPDVARLRLAITRLARRQRQQSGSGLTLSLQSALVVINADGPLTLGELAAAERIARPTITHIVDKLEQMALVVRTSDPCDGRVTRIDVTVEGRRKVTESRERRDTWMRDCLAHLTVADVDALVSAIAPLERLLAATDPVRAREA